MHKVETPREFKIIGGLLILVGIVLVLFTIYALFLWPPGEFQYFAGCTGVLTVLVGLACYTAIPCIFVLLLALPLVASPAHADSATSGKVIFQDFPKPTRTVEMSKPDEPPSTSRTSPELQRPGGYKPKVIKPPLPLIGVIAAGGLVTAIIIFLTTRMVIKVWRANRKPVTKKRRMP